MSMVIGVDVGGTFTDVFIYDTNTGAIRVVKTPSTTEDQSEGFIHGIQETGIDFHDVRSIVHGTTVGTNAVLERKGAKVGLITTQGFRDVLEMRRRERAQTWGLWGDYTPLVAREYRKEVRERVLASGDVHQSLNEGDVLLAAEELLAKGAESIAVVLLHAYSNPVHEQKIYDILEEVWPNNYISMASEILPEIREFERTSTTVVNAYIQPQIDKYLGLLESSLKRYGYNHGVQIIQSNGGMMSSDTARKRAVNTVLSGPAAGVIAAREIGRSSGYDNVITADMGGTSFDVSVIVDGQPSMQAEQKIEFGVVVRVPMIEMTTIGAGGGSIAWIDGAGMLQIGPESAGSNPGPVAFRRGGTRPTVTDANVILGRINAERPIGRDGETLDVEGAKQAILEHVGQPLGLDAYEAAQAIVTVATAKMASALRLVSVERGHDPRHFALVPFGGAGPLHASELVRECGIGTAIIPYYPGITSAIGCVMANVQHDFLRTINQGLDGLDVSVVVQILDDFEAHGRGLLSDAGMELERIDVRYEADMVYEGQTHAVRVSLPHKDITVASIRNAFERTYFEQFSRTLDRIPIFIQTVRATVIGMRQKLNLANLRNPANETSEPEFVTRQVYFNGRFVETKVYERTTLAPGVILDGPAIIQQIDTTTVIEPEMRATVDESGQVLITVQNVN